MDKMELFTARGISNHNMLKPKHFPRDDIQLQTLCNTHFPFLNQIRFKSGFQQCTNSSLRSKTSDETSTETTLYVKDETKPDAVQDYDSNLSEVSQEGSFLDIPLQVFKFFEDLDVKFDYEETYSVLVFGGGGVVALWFAAAVVNAIDSIPLLPKVLELVGLSYTLWFSSRYLLFKKNRDELVARVEQIKQQVLGSNDD
ncbi:hypothetical protein BUALT_Bualt11G0022900 [Buddleja alternifolia]|uniref:Cyanobacterial aminoacyl-tRNA synthetase CAAD domain-containing protein n=1 Tax=Buddleja alternifolia TaxID=168488 RepID=A0AAV6X2Q3_9LAMI|nr:hypothetical protein BUALT_Bualt11G0022900 [Buddleja alternifolia]